jgi:hypothetical protein
VADWQRLREKGSRERGALLAAERAYDALFDKGRPAQAWEVTRWMLETARARLAREPDDPDALRDLSISLENVGKTDRALGDWEAARGAFEEGLAIARVLADALPQHVDYRGLPARFTARLEGLTGGEEGDESG